MRQRFEAVLAFRFLFTSLGFRYQGIRTLLYISSFYILNSLKLALLVFEYKWGFIHTVNTYEYVTICKLSVDEACFVWDPNFDDDYYYLFLNAQRVFTVKVKVQLLQLNDFSIAQLCRLKWPCFDVIQLPTCMFFSRTNRALLDWDSATVENGI